MENTENAETLTAEQTMEKTFTQSEFNEALKKEVERKTKNLPSKEELNAFNEWKESQKTEKERQEEQNKINSSLVAENTSLKQMVEIYERTSNNKDEVEFIQFKLSKLEGEFKDNLETYLKDHPKKEETPKTTGFSQNTTNPTISEEKAYLDKKYANNPYYKK